MYKIILPIRYLLKKRISYLALAAVALCVFIVIVVMTVLNGLVRDFSEKNRNFVGDCVISSESLIGFGYYEEFLALLDGQDDIAGASGVVENFGLLTPLGSKKSIACELRGIDIARHCKVTGFGESLYYNSDDTVKAFSPSYDPGLEGFIAGVDLVLERGARGEYVHPDEIMNMGISVSCFPLTVKGGLAKAGAGEVNTAVVYLSDDSQSNLAKVDSGTVYLPIEKLQYLAGMNVPVARVNAIFVKFIDGAEIEGATAKIRQLWEEFKAGKSGEKYAGLFDNVRVETWKEYRREVIGPMEREQIMMTFVFVLIGLVTVFIICVIFYMIIGHKSKDIGILKSVGASNRSIMDLYLGFSVLIGVAGAAVGVAGAVVFLLKINELEGWLYSSFGFQLWDRSIYEIGLIPNEINFSLMGIVIFCAIAVCIFGAFVPSYQAARRRPVEILQVDQL